MNNDDNNGCVDMWSLNPWLDKKRKRNKKRLFWGFLTASIFLLYPLTALVMSFALDVTWVEALMAPIEVYEYDAGVWYWTRWLPIAWILLAVFVSRFVALSYYGTKKQKESQEKLKPVFLAFTLLGFIGFFVEFTPTFGYILVFILLAVIFRR